MCKIRVSVIEDVKAVREMLGVWLRGAPGFTCSGEHATGESALVAVPREKPDIVLADINLPHMSGIECVRRLKGQLPATQFIMLTVYEDTDTILKALGAGANGYLLKQTPYEELLAALSDVHAGGSPMTSTIARKVVQHFQAPPLRAQPEEGLTRREREVLELLAQGYLYKEISDALHISLATVSTHIRSIYEKYHVQSRAQAVARYARLSNDPCEPTHS